MLATAMAAPEKRTSIKVEDAQRSRASRRHALHPNLATRFIFPPALSASTSGSSRLSPSTKPYSTRAAKKSMKPESSEPLTARYPAAGTPKPVPTAMAASPQPLAPSY